jgi:apolipoprotein N-acyltransferase
MTASTLSQSFQSLLRSRPAAARLVFFAAGAMLTTAFAPLGLYVLAPPIVLALLAACLHTTPREAARLAFWFGAGLFLFGTYWLYTSIHVFGEAPLWIAVALMVGLVAIMAGYFAVIGWLIATLAAGSPWRLVAVAPASWVAVEWFRGWFLTGFPWLSIGYSQVDSPLAGWLPVLGVYGASFLVILSAAAVFAVAQRHGPDRWGALALVLLPWVGGAGLQSIEWSEPSDSPRKITIVQGGVSQDRKWLREQFATTLDLYHSSILDHRDSNLIVWPEVAIPAAIDQVEGYLELLRLDLERQRQTLLLGILEREGADIYNSVLMLEGGSREVYRKRHLVPFGEYFPVPDRVREWMRLMSLPHSDMTPGEPQQALLETAGGDRLAVAICYEDAYGAEQLYALPDATILINVSNDAWFGDSIAPHQHLEVARVRAIEAARYVVRATNNGISAFIGPRGEIFQTAPQFEHATLTMDVLPMSGATPYSVVGNWPVVVFALLIVGAFGWRTFGRHAHLKSASGPKTASEQVPQMQRDPS